MFIFMSFDVTKNTCKGGPVLGGFKGYTSYTSHGLVGIFQIQGMGSLWGGDPQNVRKHIHGFHDFAKQTCDAKI